MTVNNVDADLQKLLENATLSSTDSFTKARRPQLKPANEPTATSSIDDSDWDIISAVEGNKLTASNMKVHDLLSNETCAINERIWMREDQAKRSVLVRGTLTRCSEATVDLGESYSPGTAAMPDSDIEGVGAWTFDQLKPLMA